MKYFFILAFCIPCSASVDYAQIEKSFRQTLREMVAADTSNPPGNEKRIVDIVAKRLKEADIPYEITEFAPNRQNIVARLKGTGPEKPLLLLAHIDVVLAADQNWSTPPHQMTEKDGYLYGRGVSDNLGMAAMELEIFLQLKESKTPLRRDVILALTGDEESGGAGIQYILAHKPESIMAGIAMNEGAHLELDPNGKLQLVSIEVTQKIYRDFELSTEGDTGHSSVPLPNNAIYRLSQALVKIAAYKPVPRLIPTTRAYFKGRAALEGPVLGKAMMAIADSKGKLPAAALKEIEKNPSLAADLWTTCVATLVSGGTKVNALPSKAKANVNCRILPDETVEQVKQRLEGIVQDKKVTVTPLADFESSKSPPLDGELPTALKKVVGQLFPGTPIVPSMTKGATDSRFLRPVGVEAYGIDPLAMAEDDSRRAHGVDERISVKWLKPSLEFLHHFVLELAGTKGR